MKISIITFYVGGRDNYLLKSVNSVLKETLLSDTDNVFYEYHIIGQGCEIPEKVINELKLTNMMLKNIEFYIHKWDKNIGIGAGLNKILPLCTGDLIFKMDDDCSIVSEDFFPHAIDLFTRFPNSVFSPYPVGLINNPGGPRGFKHSVYKKSDEQVYTRRHVTHVGGFARFAPASIIKNFTFANDLISGVSGTEDGQFSAYCVQNNIEMFYLENAMVVEHIDSTLGQIVQLPEYFKNRSNESNTKVEVV